MNIDLSDVALQGSDSSYEKTLEVLSKFQIVLNMKKLSLDAYKECLQNPKCAAKIDVTVPEMFNGLEDLYFKMFDKWTEE